MTHALCDRAAAYRFVELTPGTATHFASLTNPHYRRRLFEWTPDSRIVAIGIDQAEDPVALALACYACEQSRGGLRDADLLSLFVAPAHRGRGLGTALLAATEARLKTHGCARIQLRYLENASASSLEHLLRRRQWSRPVETALVCYASTANVVRARGLHLTQMLDRLLARQPAHFEIFSWRLLTAQERADVLRLIEHDPLARRFDPFFEEDRLEPLNSLGLRKAGEIAGWLTTHRVALDTIRYTQLYVRPRCAPLSQCASLLAKAIQLQVEAGAAPKGTFRVDIDNHPMVTFVQRRLAPYLTAIRSAKLASKELHPCAISG